MSYEIIHKYMLELSDLFELEEAINRGYANQWFTLDRTIYCIGNVVLISQVVIVTNMMELVITWQVV